jgi:hypothetical protein
MWCTECNVAFDWNSGETIVSRSIHNPHYFEWVRRTGGIENNIVEGTRSNFFIIKNKTIYTTPVEKVLDGVTRRTVIDCAKKNGYEVVEKDIKLSEFITEHKCSVMGAIEKLVGKQNFQLVMT